jgi:phosphate transport system substrate-binding protein
MMALLFGGCGSGEQRQEVTTTSGPLELAVTTDLFVVGDTLAREFARIYPEVRPMSAPALTREAIVHLLSDSVQTIIIDRRLNAEEERVAAEAGIVPAGTVLAWDAMAVVVNAERRLAGMTFDALRRIVRGEATRWSQVAAGERPDPIEFVCMERNSGLYEQIQQRFTAGQPLSVFAVGASQRELVQYVGRSPRALAVVSLMALRQRPSTTRVLPVEAVVDSAAARTALVEPSQLSVFDGSYPWRTEVILYNAERRLGPGAGLASFALTTPGQKIFQLHGLVPAVIPNRVIQLTAE